MICFESLLQGDVRISILAAPDAAALGSHRSGCAYRQANLAAAGIPRAGATASALLVDSMVTFTYVLQPGVVKPC